MNVQGKTFYSYIHKEIDLTIWSVEEGFLLFCKNAGTGSYIGTYGSAEKAMEAALSFAKEMSWRPEVVEELSEFANWNSGFQVVR